MYRRLVVFRHALTALLALCGAGFAHADARQHLHAALVRNVALVFFKATRAKAPEKGGQPFSMRMLHADFNSPAIKVVPPAQ